MQIISISPLSMRLTHTLHSVSYRMCLLPLPHMQEVPRPLDFNGELVTVGISNMVTALCGAGFTGSYIFSQTIFTLRAGVLNRLNGWVVVVLELAVFAVPFSVVRVISYLPRNISFGFDGLGS